jgi:hypothetical protein
MTAPNPWRTRFAYSVGINLILIVFMWFFFSAGSQKDQTYKESIKQYQDKLSAVDAKLAGQDSAISSERDFRAKEKAIHAKRDSAYKVTESCHISTIRSLRGERAALGIIVDTTTAKIETQFQEQRNSDSTQILALQVQIVKDGESFLRELGAERTKVHILEDWKAENKTLVLSLYEELSDKNKIIARLERIARTLGITTGVATAVLILIIAL